MPLSRAVPSLALLLLAAACGGEARQPGGTGSPGITGPSSDYRCRLDQPDGSCTSMPANCPVTLSHPDVPNCEPGATLIRAVDDQCAHRAICVD